MIYSMETLKRIMNEAGVTFDEAKDAFARADGDVEAAIAALRQDAGCADRVECSDEETRTRLNDVKTKLTDIIKRGNARKISLKRGGKELFSVPLNLGLLGGIVGVAYAPVAVIVGAIAAYGFDCRIEVENRDGTTEEVE